MELLHHVGVTHAVALTVGEREGGRRERRKTRVKTREARNIFIKVGGKERDQIENFK